MTRLFPIACVFLTALLILGFIPLQTVTAASPTLRFIPEFAELGPEDVVGKKFKVALVIENIEGLYGFDIQFSWTAEWISYVPPFVLTVPASSYPPPNPPSPYSGVLNPPTMPVRGEVYDSWAWFAATSMMPAMPFSGNGTVVVLQFEVIKQPTAPDEALILFHFMSTDLADKDAHPIPHSRIDLEIPLHGRLPFNIRIENVQHGGVVCYENNFFVDVNVTNDGPYPQTVELILIVNSSNINSTSISLEGYETNNTVIEWKTQGYDLGNYNISVYAVPIYGESNTTDNLYNAGTAIIKVIGDVDDDLDVDIYDIVAIATIYGKTDHDPEFKEKCDLIKDGVINIFDVVTCAAYYGTRYP